MNFLRLSGVTVPYHNEDAKLQLQINKKKVLNYKPYEKIDTENLQRERI